MPEAVESWDMTPDRQPWGVGRAEYVRRMAEGHLRSSARKLLGSENRRLRDHWLAEHRQLVVTALAAGKPVPPEVLQDYPDLAQPAAQAAGPLVPVPSQQDIDNARIRREIAERQEAAWVECCQWALAHFGPGWLPAYRYFLVDHDEQDRVRYTAERPHAAATVYTVKNAEGHARHFTVADGQVVEHANYQDGFGAMLLEPHPTRTIEVRGERVHPHRYSLCWAPYALYRPKSAEELAKLRASRERKQAERAAQQFAEDYPLFARVGQPPEV